MMNLKGYQKRRDYPQLGVATYCVYNHGGDVVEDVPRGIHVNFLKAERSLHRWALGDLQRIHTAEEQASQKGGGVEMHVLEDAGH
ncbi:hypothetical protein Tco_0844557 [Tanacetum coccineum]